MAGKSGHSEESASTSAHKALPRHLQDLVDLLPLNQPVHRSVIAEAYNKTGYARRIRKIVAEYGWDIERRRGDNGANDDWYIRRSDGPVRPQQIRREVPKARRLEIYERDDWVCQACHADVSDEQLITQPQCDHRVPPPRGGSSDSENLQTLCTRCNLKKRQACHYCALPSCEGCPWAFPEEFANRWTVQLPDEVSASIQARARAEGVAAETLLARLIEEAWD